VTNAIGAQMMGCMMPKRCVRRGLIIASSGRTASQIVGVAAFKIHLKSALVLSADDPQMRTALCQECLYNSYRPRGNEDVRTAAEILLHVAALNSRIAFTMRTKPQKDALAAEGKVPNALHYPYVSKQDTVAKVKESFVAVRKAIQDNPDPGSLGDWLWVVAHSSEHFGNLVAYYRDNGLIPPTSRK
jgi:hypothetical protein